MPPLRLPWSATLLAFFLFFVSFVYFVVPSSESERPQPATFSVRYRPETRVAELADRSNEGLLTQDERAEYDSYVEGAEILGLIKLKARRYLLANGGN
jgi:hypothetical protein